ncbi:MAG: hypothetical protein KBS40_00370, partial [Bacteroidales bacterium]|nr:hypothetical protein [Bacteroidales bacterium]
MAKKAVAVEQMQKVQIEKAQFANFNQLSATPAMKVINQKGAMAPMAKNNRLMANHQAAPAKPAVRKAVNAVAEDINVTATSVYASDYYGYLDYYMYVEGGAYDFSGIAPVEGKTYTLADMDPDYTGWYANEDEGDITTKATAATLTVSKKNGLPYVVGTMTIGGNNYTITYELKLTDTVTVNATNLAVKSHYYGGYEYTFNDADWTFDIVDFDMAAKTGTLANIDFDYSSVYPTGGSSWDAFYFSAVIEDVVVAQDADTMKLTGAIAAENGILYVLNARYEKPAAKEITLVADTLNFFTKMLNAGYYQMQGYTADSTYAFSFYFLSKSLTGFFTEEDMDSYSTWVDQKDGKKTVVSYQNLSAANIKASLVNDTLYYTGTMTLATNDGQEANITLNLSCPFKQEWGEWADFAPFDLNTGKYTLNAVFDSAVVKNVPVKERKDNTGLKQYQFLNLGKGYYGTDGINMTINMDAKRICTIKPVLATIKTSATTTMNIILTDAYTATGAADYAEASYYNPEKGTFNLFVVALSETYSLLAAGKETMVMDKPITERDTVYVNSKMLSSFYEESIKGYVYQSSNADYELIQFVTNKDTKLGTFAYSDLQYGYSYLRVHKTDKTAILFQDGEITVSEDQEGFKLTGLMIGEDEKAYVFNLIQPASVISGDTDAPFDAEFNYSDMKASIKDGVISISVNNGEKTIGLELYADPAATTIPAGTYTISDSKEAGTALQSVGLNGNSLTKCYAGTVDAGYVDDCWFMVEGTITLSYDEYGKLKVEVNAENSYGQPVTALVKYEKLEPKSVVTIEADNMTFEGVGTMFQLDAANKNYEVVLTVMSTDTAGTYGVDNLVGAYSAIYSADGSQVSILDGEFTLALNGKEMTLTGSLLASDTIQYDLNITGYMGALPYDGNDNYEATFELDSADVQTGAATTLTVTNDNNQMVALMFFAKATGNKLPAGTYPINSTKAKNTVLASQGITTSGPTYSFAAETNDEGSITAPWWMVGGEVVVAEDGSITVNAINSYDKTITINIVAAAPEVTDYYLVGWINGAAYGIEGDIDNFGDYHFVDGKVTAT